MNCAISVTICSHNPRRNYLQRVTAALKNQTLPSKEWELLLIDNASDTVLATEVDLSWHSNARNIREDRLGLTPARLRGIREAQAELLVFVDDDNVLNPDYLEVALQISEKFTILGAWGGQTIPEFEEPPPDWTRPYWLGLAIREFEQDRWSNLPNQYETTPCGAGMCIRKAVAEKYASLVRHDPRRLNMGRKGKALTSYEDSDMAFTACDLGLGTGRFANLKLIHLMPPERLQEEYLLRLVEASSYSGTIVESFRGKMPTLQPKSWERKLIEWYRFWRMTARQRRFYKASQRGLALAIKEISG